MVFTGRTIITKTLLKREIETILSTNRSVVPKDLFHKQTKKRRENISPGQEIMKNKIFERIKAGLVVSGAVAGKKNSLIIR